MVCYARPASRLAAIMLVAWLVFAMPVRHYFDNAALVMAVTVATAGAVVAAALAFVIFMSVRRRRAAAGGCVSCQFRCQHAMTGPHDRARHDRAGPTALAGHHRGPQAPGNRGRPQAARTRGRPQEASTRGQPEAAWTRGAPPRGRSRPSGHPRVSGHRAHSFGIGLAPHARGAIRRRCPRPSRCRGLRPGCAAVAGPACSAGQPGISSGARGWRPYPAARARRLADVSRARQGRPGRSGAGVDDTDSPSARMASTQNRRRLPRWGSGAKW